jgi:hypothetical protein
MLSFLKAYMPKPLHPPSICTHDFLYIHPLIFKLCKALLAKLHPNMKRTFNSSLKVRVPYFHTTPILRLYLTHIALEKIP